MNHRDCDFKVQNQSGDAKVVGVQSGDSLTLENDQQHIGILIDKFIIDSKRVSLYYEYNVQSHCNTCLQSVYS